MTLRNTAYIQEAIYYVVYVLNEKKNIPLAHI